MKEENTNSVWCIWCLGFGRTAPQGRGRHDPRTVEKRPVHYDHLPTRAFGTLGQVLRSQVPQQGQPRRVRHPRGGLRLR